MIIILSDLNHLLLPTAIQVCPELEFMHFIQTVHLILGFYSILIKGAGNGFSLICEHLLLSTLTFASLLIRVNFSHLGTDLCPRSSSMCMRVGISEWQKMGIGLDLRFYDIPYHWQYA
jgi:hypothetical protein